MKELNAQLFALDEFSKIKIIIYVEHTVEVDDLQDVIWRFANNLDARRDSFVVQAKDANSCSHIGFDGTRKTKALDNFDRDWPNILCSKEETIKSIDEKWNSLGLGKFISSPSLNYKDQLYGRGAVVEE